MKGQIQTDHVYSLLFGMEQLIMVSANKIESVKMTHQSGFYNTYERLDNKYLLFEQLSTLQKTSWCIYPTCVPNYKFLISRCSYLFYKAYYIVRFIWSAKVSKAYFRVAYANFSTPNKTSIWYYTF